MHLPKWWYIVYELQRTVGMDIPPPEQPQENTGKYKSPALPRKKKDILGSVDLFLFLNGFWFFLVKLLQYTDNNLVWFSKPVNILLLDYVNCYERESIEWIKIVLLPIAYKFTNRPFRYFCRLMLTNSAKIKKNMLDLFHLSYRGIKLVRQIEIML